MRDSPRPQRPNPVVFALGLPLVLACIALFATWPEATDTDPREETERLPAATGASAPTPSVQPTADPGITTRKTLPTPVQIPTETDEAILANSPPDRPCATMPSGAIPGDTTFIDLDLDGSVEAITPTTRDAFTGRVDYAVLRANGECGWVELGRLQDGTVRHEDQDVERRWWTCSPGQRTDEGHHTLLVQVSERSEADGGVGTTAIQQFGIANGQFVEHRPTTMTQQFALPHASACNSTSLIQVQTQPVEACGGPHWIATLPDRWQTTPAGAASCQWFDEHPMVLPCQCDAIPPISVRFTVDVPPLGDRPVTRSTIDGYPARTTEQRDMEGMGGLRVNTRSHYIDIGTGTITLSAHDQDWSGTWDELVAILDAFAASFDVTGAPVPTPAMFYPDFPEISENPLHVDPRGVFAWYATTSSRKFDCDYFVPLALLDIAASTPGDLKFSPTGRFPTARVVDVDIVEPGRATATGDCIAGSSWHPFDYASDGSVTERYAPNTPEEFAVVHKPEGFAVSPDGRFRYASGTDPLERLNYGCTIGTQRNPSFARTILRYEGTDIAPAFRDVGLTGHIYDMKISSGGIAVWESHSCQSSSLWTGRLDDQGFIVDRHPVSGHGGNTPSWALKDDGELIILQPTQISADEFVVRDELDEPIGGNTVRLPGIVKIDLARSAGWVMTADPPPRVDTNPIGTGFDPETSWHLGENLVDDSECAGQTIYRKNPDGFRRMSDYRRDFEGDVADVITSEINGNSRAVVALVQCPSEYDGYAVWYASEYERSDSLVFTPADLAPITAMTDLTVRTDPWRIEAVVTQLDGGAAEVELAPANCTTSKHPHQCP